MTLDILGLAVTLVLALLADLTECGPWLAERLVRWAARRLDDPQAAARYEEEWLANLEQVPGRLIPLIYAVGMVINVPCMRRALKPPKPDKSEKRSPRPAWGFGYAVGRGVDPRVDAELSVALDHGLMIALGHGLIVGLVAGLVYGLLVGLMAGLGYGLIVGLVVWLGYALSYILVSGLARMLNRATSRR